MYFKLNRTTLFNRTILLSVILFFGAQNIVYAANKDEKGAAYTKYIEFFEEVYDVMNKNYFKPIERGVFEEFLNTFDEKIYSKLEDKDEVIDSTRWRSADLLIKKLKETYDIFSAFYPPKPAKEYVASVLGRKIDLGIVGELVKDGYEATQVEPRSDAYVKGLRIGDIIVKIDENDIKEFNVEKINELLTPFADEQVRIGFFDKSDSVHRDIDVVSKNYFKQQVFIFPTKAAGIYGLEIVHFNRKTAEDIFRFLEYFKKNGPINGLIIDLRGNPGGSPLAAREFSSFFLEPDQEKSSLISKEEMKRNLCCMFPICQLNLNIAAL
ncbi:MAG: S41 family peptidase [Candidatus Zapsychrus exili]|nr:S41 family peptidase [Candidatus Zapsychrus exili]